MKRKSIIILIIFLFVALVGLIGFKGTMEEMSKEREEITRNYLEKEVADTTYGGEVFAEFHTFMVKSNRAYIWSYTSEYYEDDGSVYQGRASSGPRIIYFSNEKEPVDHFRPGHGSYYSESIKEKFPFYLHNKVLSFPSESGEVIQNLKEKIEYRAEKYFDKKIRDREEVASKKQIQKVYEEKDPEYWGEMVPGVIKRIDTEEKVVALTLDACDGDYDRELIAHLRKEDIPATLFIASPWIENNEKELEALADDPLFYIAGHGKDHLPLSVEGKEAYGEKGTGGVKEVMEEIVYNSRDIEEVTGKEPSYFRSGTAHYDEVAVSIANSLNKKVIGFTVAADGGTTFSKEEIKEAVLGTGPGGIILAHMNHPNSEIAKGLIEGIISLREEGYRFIHLKEYEDKFYEL